MPEKNTYHKLPILDGLELLDARDHTVDFPFHTHDTFNIALILKHTFNTKLTDNFLQAPIGTLSITNPYEVHATPCDSMAGNSFFTFYIAPDILKRLNKGNDVFFQEKVIYDKRLFGELYFLSQNFSADPQLEKKVLAVLARLVKSYASSLAPGQKQRKMFQSFLMEDGVEKFSLEQMAHRFELDKFKFLRLFKHQTGLTPNNYVMLKRIQKSKELLQADGDLLHVAFESGFYDVAHLCRHFKRFTGVTPLAYRQAW
jgi:AraC-like DNA-binding protein